jgi:hypothetical protein
MQARTSNYNNIAVDVSVIMKQKFKLNKVDCVVIDKMSYLSLHNIVKFEVSCLSIIACQTSLFSDCNTTGQVALVHT